MTQQQQQEWVFQWREFQDDSLALFVEWIYPNTLDDFRDKDVLDAGCGGGQHLAFVAPYARRVVGADLNTIEIAKGRTTEFRNVTLREADIAEMNLGRKFDVVYSIGVIHHTDNPDKTVENLKRHVKPGGRLILSVYAREGNFIVRTLLEPAKRHLFLKLPRPLVRRLAAMLTALMYFPVYTVYLLPLRFLPYYQYLQRWRGLSFKRNLLNVFDQLNAPQTQFFPREQVEKWIHPGEFTRIHISHHKGMSWRASGTKI